MADTSSHTLRVAQYLSGMQLPANLQGLKLPKFVPRWYEPMPSRFWLRAPTGWPLRVNLLGLALAAAAIFSILILRDSGY